MKKIILYTLLYFLVSNGFSQAFVTTWNTGTDNYIVIPGYGTNYNIQWEEIGNPSHNGSMLGKNITKVNLGTSGIYRVSINGGSPAFNRINFGLIYKNFSNPSFVHSGITAVEQWGNIIWDSLDSAFYYCRFLTSITGVPNLSYVTSMASMFNGAQSFNDTISNWNTANVTNMSFMFWGADSFNKPLGNWNTSSVTDMTGMFCSAHSFNQPINSWNTANVTNMRYMFLVASNFNQPINSWNTANVTNMESMFAYASNFNQPIGNWNTATVTNMSHMFQQASLFNQPIGNWNTSNVTDMSYMFTNVFFFNQPIGSWNTSNVTDMSYMFCRDMYAGSNPPQLQFNQPIDGWNTANVTNMDHMFSNASNFNQPIGSWNTSKVKNMRAMFSEASNFNQPIGNWSTSNVTNMGGMFTLAKLFNQSLTNWNTSNVIDMGGMFSNAYAFNQAIGNWNTSNVADMGNMFNQAYSFNQNIGYWDINSASYIGLMFSGIDTKTYDSIINQWSNKQCLNNVQFASDGLHYCTSSSQRSYLINSRGWSFSGDSYNCTLPIHLTSFTATPQQSKVLLQWQTATETNNSYFTVQRSSNQDNWQDIATIKGEGNSSVANSYTSTDNHPLQGISYYRIKQTDFNGNVSYSEVRQVAISKEQLAVSIYPNPASKLLHINAESKAILRIYNAVGKQIAIHNLTQGDNSINIEQLFQGIYIAIIETANGVVREKITKE